MRLKKRVVQLYLSFLVRYSLVTVRRRSSAVECEAAPKQLLPEQSTVHFSKMSKNSLILTKYDIWAKFPIQKSFLFNTVVDIFIELILLWVNQLCLLNTRNMLVSQHYN